MIEIEKRIKLNDLENVTGISGLYLIRVASKVPMTTEVARMAVINHLRGEIEAKYANTTSYSVKKDNFLKDLETLSNLPIIYSKIDTFEGDYGKIEYHQIVLNLTDEEREKTAHRNSGLGNISYSLMQNLYSSYGDAWKVPQCPMNDFIYTIADIKPDRRNNTMMIRNNDESLNKFIEQEYKPYNHIALSYTTNITKSYNRNSIVKMMFHIWDNLADAFKNKEANTLGIDQHDSLFGRFNFMNYKSDRHGSTKMVIYYKSKPTLLWHKDMAIFYDGEKSLEDIKPYLDIWYERGIRQLDILQFCRNKDFFYQDSMGYNFLANKLVLLFIAKDKINLPRSEMRCRNGRSFSGRIMYNPRKEQKRICLEIGFGNNNPNMGPYLGTAVIPVDNTNVQTKALEVLNNMIKITLPLSTTIETENFEDNYDIYRNCVFGMGEAQPDTLSEWFKYCTRTSKQNDDNIVRAYEKMKKDLEREYKELGTYLNHYDFSKCMPIPRILTDEKLIENYYKSLHIEAKNIIINSINHKNIKSIQELQPTITFMFIDRKGRIRKGDFPIAKFYNSKTNEVELFYNRLKGEVNRDKVENRR